ncbi:c-5 sterol desaturase [Scheffersomyces spartinae]|uniref:C-5 sterol desaturase n=1 Tax=Scheffersomyces spartinae TaxID=45513 RepID=A0A9P7V724_9ASCO|nr:c-5 sterol desaturase [Scheffersomyces spartinae]KAG7192318.1 c-5 sterol desaturase [Scheffersomyces spartinae]
MDIVLEVCDTYLFDKFYATVLPKNGVVAQKWSQLTYGSVLSHNSTIAAAATAAGGVDGDSGFLFRSSGWSLPLPVQIVVNLIGKLQRKDEIYGKVPTQIVAPSIWATESFLARSNLLREALSIFVITTIFGWLLYFLVAGLSYMYVFDRRIFNHPRYLKNQMRLEIIQAATSIPIMVLLTNPFFVLELQGFSKLYFPIDDSTGGWNRIWWSIPAFILFTDCGIYFIHRWLHWPSVYKALHKPHHKWIVCTPFASHAFHPVDGWCQSLPYHIYPLLFPLHKVLYLALFLFVNCWTVMIHDGNYMSNDPVVNGTACHTVHHLYFNYNYGQFTTLWDRIGGSYRRPDDSLFLKDTQKEQDKKIWKEQVVQMEEIRNELEGKVDDRVYIEEE